MSDPVPIPTPTTFVLSSGARYFAEGFAACLICVGIWFGVIFALAVPSVDLPATAKGQPGEVITLHAGTSHASVAWAKEGGILLFPQGADADVLALKAGEYKVSATARGWLRSSEPRACVVTVGEPTPPDCPAGQHWDAAQQKCVPDKPPPPPPPPVVKANRVLIVYDSATATTMPPAQQTILFGKAPRDFLDAKTAVGPDGKTHEWRIYDKTVDASGDAKVWSEWLNRPRASTPWLIIGGDGGVAFEGPLPADVPSFLALVGKYIPTSSQLRRAG